MYDVLPSFVLAFHGCDATVAEAVLSGRQSLKESSNPHDWLGTGIYFWENSPVRATDYAVGREGLRPFDTVRAAFIEGQELYPGSSFRDRNPIQICVRNVSCIKGYFRPLSEPADPSPAADDRHA